MVAIDELAPDLVRKIDETFVAIGGEEGEEGDRGERVLAHMLATGSRGRDPSVRPPIDSSSYSPLAVNSFSPGSVRAYLG